MSGLRIGAVIPAHDESATIGAVVEGLRAYPEVVAMVVVDDASTDGTAQAAAAAGAQVLRLEPGQGGGKGRALRAGLARVMDQD
ncbi:MAG TPA: glycosyltransferase, partial [Holophaga sp.]|nr:glycosyltransferase [Holophaga sp.]